MLFPSKVIPYNESILPLFPIILRYLEHGPKKIRDVYKHTRNNMEDINVFFEALDCLYALGKIDLNNNDLLMKGKEEAE